MSHVPSLGSASAIWKQEIIPVIFKPRQGMGPLHVKLPYREDNRDWLKGGNARRPDWVKQYKCWTTPRTWFNELVRKMLVRHGKVYLIQAYKELEKCAPACWKAQGFDCECSCMGVNHGRGGGEDWYEISETLAVRGTEERLSCRLVTLR